jgi:hypothetical protein
VVNVPQTIDLNSEVAAGQEESVSAIQSFLDQTEVNTSNEELRVPGGIKVRLQYEIRAGYRFSSILLAFNFIFSAANGLVANYFILITTALTKDLQYL